MSLIATYLSQTAFHLLKSDFSILSKYFWVYYFKLSPHEVKEGVPQGSDWGLLLFPIRTMALGRAHTPTKVRKVSSLVTSLPPVPNSSMTCPCILMCNTRLIVSPPSSTVCFSLILVSSSVHFSSFVLYYFAVLPFGVWDFQFAHLPSSAWVSSVHFLLNQSAFGSPAVSNVTKLKQLFMTIVLYNLNWERSSEFFVSWSVNYNAPPLSTELNQLYVK